jgi:protein-tyrosine phosphatase
MNQLLFLCTANYYRSRFSEQYFNHHAALTGLNWRADSKAITRHPLFEGVEGPMSPHSIEYLAEIGLQADTSRFPARVEDEHFDHYHRVIAASRDEHYPMMQEHFPHRANGIHYFTVEDLHIYGPERALPHLVQSLDALLEELRLAG